MASMMTEDHKPLFHTQHKSDVYDPSLSTTSPSALRDWLHQPVCEDIRQVPGIGPKTAEILAAGNAGTAITSTFQLLGAFLTCKGSGVDPVVHCNRFHEFLRSKGVHSHVNSIVQACAEKCNIMFPGIYDGEYRDCFVDTPVYRDCFESASHHSKCLSSKGGMEHFPATCGNYLKEPEIQVITDAAGVDGSLVICDYVRWS